jgi:hypothetical protein
MSNTQPPRQLRHAGFALGCRQVGDGFDVILGGFERAIAAGTPEILRRLSPARMGDVFALARGIFFPIETDGNVLV